MSERSDTDPAATGTDPDGRRGPSTGPVRLGVDAAGRLHVYDPRRDRVTVLDGDGIEHVEDLNGRSVNAWRAYVAERRGWRRPPVRYLSARELFGREG